MERGILLFIQSVQRHSMKSCDAKIWLTRENLEEWAKEGGKVASPASYPWDLLFTRFAIQFVASRDVFSPGMAPLLDRSVPSSIRRPQPRILGVRNRDIWSYTGAPTGIELMIPAAPKSRYSHV